MWLLHRSSWRHYVNGWAWLCSNKTLFTKTRMEFDLSAIVCQPFLGLEQKREVRGKDQGNLQRTCEFAHQRVPANVQLFHVYTTLVESGPLSLLCPSQTTAVGRSETTSELKEGRERQDNAQSDLQVRQRDWAFLILELKLWCRVPVGFPVSMKWPGEAHSLVTVQPGAEMGCCPLSTFARGSERQK